jgi:GNAT superfamily N-acetyltransferase
MVEVVHGPEGRGTVVKGGGITAYAHPVAIRDATIDDAVAIADAHIRSWQAAYRDLLPSEFLDGLGEHLEGRVKWWRRVLRADPEDVLVAEDEGLVAGFARVAKCRDEDHGLLHRYGEVQAIYLIESAWGKGLGKDLMAAAEQRLASRRLGPLCVWVLGKNTRARRFYEAAGWAADGVEKEETMPWATLHEVRYVKDVS